MRTALRGALLAIPAVVIFLLAPPRRFLMDDRPYIIDNAAVNAGVPLRAYFADPRTTAFDPELTQQSWRPLRTLAYRAVVVLAGMRPVAFGVANLALYIVCALLVQALARKLGAAPGMATAAAVLWVVAPVHIEPLLYASSLGDHLSLALQLGALLAALRDRRWAGASLVLASAAVLTKEMAVTTPVLLALVAWSTGDLRTRPRSIWMLVAAHVAVALLFVVARTAVLRVVGHAPLSTGGVAQALALGPARLAEYLRICLVPVGHHPGYILPWPGIAVVGVTWVGLAVAAYALRRTARPVRIGAAWFVVSLLPVMNFVPVAAALTDRFALLPTVGLALMVPPALAALERRWARAPALATALLAALYLVGSIIEARAWNNDLTLWEKSVKLEPASAQSHRNFGLALMMNHQPERALPELDRARELGDASLKLDYWRALALQASGRNDEAARAAEVAAARDPEGGRTQALHGFFALRRGNVAVAEKALADARRTEPTHPMTSLLAIDVAGARGDHATAVATAHDLVTRYPDDAGYRYRQGMALAASGNFRASAEAARGCLGVTPGHPLCNCLLGRVLIAAGERNAEARAALDAGLPRMAPGPEREACQVARNSL